MIAALTLPESGEQSFTDYTRWRLKADDGGRHIWHYLETDEELAKWPQNTIDRYWLGLPTVNCVYASLSQRASSQTLCLGSPQITSS